MMMGITNIEQGFEKFDVLGVKTTSQILSEGFLNRYSLIEKQKGSHFKNDFLFVFRLFLKK
jgi:hypothetical protein